MTLNASQARAYYDRFGQKQDSQGFYEDAALDALIAHARLDQAQAVFEFGCGTGRLAERLLSEHLPPEAAYSGCDLSPTMVELAEQRLARFGQRASVLRSDGEIRLPVSDRSVDRVVSTYVLDLLSEPDIAAFWLEAHRALAVGGLLCLASLTHGATLLSKAVAGAWSGVSHLRASLVGGCRPIRLTDHLDPQLWELEHREVVVAYGVPSEVLIARSG